jgi:hypothetical protein
LFDDQTEAHTVSTTPAVFQVQNLVQAVAPFRVEIPDLGEVKSYLQGHPDLAELLVPICRQIRDVLGHQAELSLEVYRDPECSDHYLTLFVRQRVYEPDLLARIEQVSSRFEEQLSERSGWLLVTTDFRPPGRKRITDSLR